MKRTDIFDRLNNTIGNHMEGKATDQDLIEMAYEVDKYLLEHPHPHDLIKNNVALSDVVVQGEQLSPKRKPKPIGDFDNNHNDSFRDID
jgi:hypothetical protein